MSKVKLTERERNAKKIQKRLNKLLKLAHKAGVQIEYHQYKDNEPTETIELSRPPKTADGDGPDWDGDFLVANQDVDRDVKIKL